jgi:CMP-N-acetylneuraminic acid synthetase
MKILAVIPARQNSARVPGKNTLRLGPDGKANLVRAIEAVKECERIDKIAVVSDDPKARNLGSMHGCLALREPPHVAKVGDLYDVMDFALRSVQGNWDAVVLAYANCPIRPPGIFPELVDLLITTEADSWAARCPTRNWGGSSIFGINYLQEMIADRTAIDRHDVRFLEYQQDEVVEIDNLEDVTWANTLLNANSYGQPN